MMGLAVVWAFFGAAYLAHALVCRLRFGGNSVVKFVIVGSAARLALLGSKLRAGLPLAELWPEMLLYAFVCEVYIFLFTFTGTSVSA